MAFLGQIRTLAYGALRGFRNLSLSLVLGISAAVAEPVTVAALGDSLTQGYGLAPAQGFVPQLQAWLDARGADVVVRNAGVSGDTSQGGLARVGWTLTPDVDAMIVALGGNDMLRGVDPAVVRANLAGILQAAQGADVRVLLVGVEGLSNYGADYKAEFDAVFPELAAEFGVAYVARFLAGVKEAVAAGRPMAELILPDGLHPNADGVALNVEVLGPAVLELIARVD